MIDWLFFRHGDEKDQTIQELRETIEVSYLHLPH